MAVVLVYSLFGTAQYDDRFDQETAEFAEECAMVGDLASQELDDIGLDEARQSDNLGPTCEPRSLLPAEVSPMTARAQQAFERDLPGLLLSCAGRWVAYHGERQVRFGDSMLDLYRECFEMGIKPDELVVRLVDPEQIDERLEIDLTHDV